MVGDAKVSVINNQTGAVRDVVSGADGAATISALPLNGTYTVSVTKQGFGTEERNDVALRAGETAMLRVKLLVGSEKSEVTVYGTTEGVRADAQIGRRLDSATIDETPILGRKISTLPLFNSAFRQAKGTGDLFVNATYFVTGAGSRRTTTFTIDGVNNDEGWGRQTMLSTVPLGAVQEMTALSNAFSSEFGFTAGPAVSIVTKSGTNQLHGEGLYLARPGAWQAKTFGTDGFCAPSVTTCLTPSTLTAINPADVPDVLNQVSASVGTRVRQGQDLLLRERRLHGAGSHGVPVADAAVVRAAGRRQPRLRRQLPPGTHQRKARPEDLASPDADAQDELRSVLRHEPQ